VHAWSLQGGYRQVPDVLEILISTTLLRCCLFWDDPALDYQTAKSTQPYGTDYFPPPFVHNLHRTLFAMPECGIGLYPDIGASFFLNQLPARMGLLLGLTGLRLKGEGSAGRPTLICLLEILQIERYVSISIECLGLQIRSSARHSKVYDLG